MFLLEEDRPPLPPPLSWRDGVRVVAAVAVGVVTTLCVAITELMTTPSAAVEKEVKVVGTVVDPYKVDEMTKSDVRVERLMVELPTTTISEVGEDTTLDVTEEPTLDVVVISTLLGDAVVDCSDVDASEVEEVVVDVASVVVGVVGAADVGASDEIGVDTEVDVVVVVESVEVKDDMVVDSSVVEGASVVDVVTPVPTTCLLGMMPSGMLSAPICEKKRENMMVETIIE